MKRKKLQIDEGIKKAISEMNIFEPHTPNRATAYSVLSAWREEERKK